MMTAGDFLRLAAVAAIALLGLLFVVGSLQAVAKGYRKGSVMDAVVAAGFAVVFALLTVAAIWAVAP